MDKSKVEVDTVAELVDRKRFSIRLWLLPVAGALVYLTTAGTMQSNSLIFIELMEREHAGRFWASLPFSLLGVASITIAPLMGFFGSKMPLFYFASTGLLLVSLGQVACFFSANLYAVIVFIGYIRNCGITVLISYVPQVINIVFKENTATAMGIATLGDPLSGFLWPFLFQYFLDNYGFNGAFLLSAGVSLHAMVGIIMISNYMKGKEASTDRHSLEIKDKDQNHQDDSDEDLVNPKRNGKNTVEGNNSTKSNDCLELSEECKSSRDLLQNENRISKKRLLIKVITSRPIYMLSITNTSSFLVLRVLTQVIVDYMNDKGLDRQSALLMLTIVAFGGLIGRLSLGWIVDKKLTSSQLHQSLTLLVIASALMVTTYVGTFQILGVCYFIVGICQASVMVTNWAQYSFYYKEEELLMAFSVFRFLNGLEQLTRSPLIGLFRDVYQSYEYLFRALSILMFLLSALWILEDYLHKRGNRSKEYNKVPSDDPDGP